MKPRKLSLSFGLEVKTSRAWKRLRTLRLSNLLLQHRRNMQTLLALMPHRERYEVGASTDERGLRMEMAPTVPDANDRRSLPAPSPSRANGLSALPIKREQRSMGLVLRGEGLEVVEADDEAKLLAEMTAMLLDDGTATLDMVISEHCLPGITGLSVLASQNEQRAATAFILITDNADAQAKALQLGAVVLDKRFDAIPPIRSAKTRRNDPAVLSSLLIQRTA
jgi:CheY-like chemotaxis protein